MAKFKWGLISFLLLLAIGIIVFYFVTIPGSGQAAVEMQASQATPSPTYAPKATPNAANSRPKGLSPTYVPKRESFANISAEQSALADDVAPEDNTLHICPTQYIDENGDVFYDLMIPAEYGSHVILYSSLELTSKELWVRRTKGILLRMAEGALLPGAPVESEEYVATPEFTVTRPNGSAYEVICEPITFMLPRTSIHLDNPPDINDGGVYRTGSEQVVFSGVTDNHLVTVMYNGKPLTVYDGGIFTDYLNLADKEGFLAGKPYSYPVEIVAQRDNYVTTRLRFTIQYDPALAPATPRPTATPKPTPTPTPEPNSFIGGGETYAGIDGRFYTVQQAAEPLKLTESHRSDYDYIGSFEAVKGQQTEFTIIEQCDREGPDGGTYSMGPVLTVGGKSLSLGMIWLDRIYCVDIDRSDPYKELFIFTGLFHADKYLHVVRFDGENLWQMCTGIFANQFIYCNSDELAPETCVTLNGKGVVTVPSDRFDLINPAIVTSMWKEVNGMLVETPVAEIALGIPYTLKKGELFFVEGEYDEISNYDDFPWDAEPGNGMLQVKAGDTITFIKQKLMMDSKEYEMDSEPLGMAYYVDINGRKGFLYDYFDWFTDVY